MLERESIISTWQKDFEEDSYFIHLKNGDAIGYCDQAERFCLNNGWNEISYDEAEKLIKRYGVDS